MKKALGLVSIISVVIFWGISFISASQILEVVNPIVLGFFRYILAVVFVGVIVIAKRVDMRVSKGDLLIFFVAGLLGIFLYSILENTALTLIPAAAASILTALTPMTMIVGNFFVYRERISVSEALLILISIAGIVLVLFDDLTVSTSLQDMLGYGLMLLSLVFWTIYSLMTKKVSQKYSSLKITAIQSIMALLLFIPTLLIPGTFPNFQIFSPGDWWNLLFLGVICSGVCYFLFIHSIHVLGVTLPNLLLNFIPIVTIVTNAIIGHQTISPLQIIGGIVVVASMTVLTIDNLKKSEVK